MATGTGMGMGTAAAVSAAGEGIIAMAWNDHTREGVESRATGKIEKVPEKCRTALSVAVSHDRGDTWQRAGVVAGVVGPGLAPGLRFHHPWMLRVGCKILVAYSKFYVSWYGMGKKKRRTSASGLYTWNWRWLPRRSSKCARRTC